MSSKKLVDKEIDYIELVVEELDLSMAAMEELMAESKEAKDVYTKTLERLKETK